MAFDIELVSHRKEVRKYFWNSETKGQTENFKFGSKSGSKELREEFFPGDQYFWFVGKYDVHFERISLFRRQI